MNKYDPWNDFSFCLSKANVLFLNFEKLENAFLERFQFLLQLCQVRVSHLKSK